MVRFSTQVNAELKSFFRKKNIKAKVSWHSDFIEIALPKGLRYYSKDFPTTEFNGVIGDDYDYKVIIGEPVHELIRVWKKERR